MLQAKKDYIRMHEELFNQYKTIIGAYLGVQKMDEYSLKVYVLQDIRKYQSKFKEDNQLIVDDDLLFNEVENKSVITQLQDALNILEIINGPRDLIFLIEAKIRELMK